MENLVTQSSEDIFSSVPSLENSGTVFDDIRTDNQPQAGQPALTNKTLITTLASMNTDKNPDLQLTEDSIQVARGIIESGQELTFRTELASKKALRQLSNLNSLKMDKVISPEDSAGVDMAYNNVLNWDIQNKAKIASEDQAFENIKVMAARDPVQAKVLLDNLEKGDAEQVIHDYQIKMSILSQRAEELDREYGEEGWGKTIFNFLASVVPTNYNFQRSGIVDGADTGALDWLFSGEGLRKQSEQMWNMSPEEFADYASADGPLMQAIRSNATTPFGMTHDAAAAKDLLASLTNQSDSDRQWANTWGSVEVASLGTFKTAQSVLSLPKTLKRAGARKESVELLTKAADTLEREGPEAMTKATGVTEGELKAAQSITAVDPLNASTHSVPVAIDLATREAAAREALAKLPGIIQEQRLTQPDEVMAAYKAAEDQIAKDIGKPIKDVAHKVEYTADGREIRYVEATFGTKGGGGYAKEGTARNAAEPYGGEVFRDESGQWFVRSRVNVSEAGFYTEALDPPAQGLLGRMTGRFWRSPSRTTDSGLHGKAVQAGSTINRAQRILGNSMDNIFKALPKASRDVVEQITLVGSNKKKFFSDEEFRVLVQRRWNREATQQELTAYQQVVKHNDMDWVLRKDLAYTERVAKGYESFSFRTTWDQQFELQGNVSRSPDVVPKDSAGNFERVYNASDNVHYTGQNPLSAAELDRLRNGGYIMLKPETAIKLPDGTTVKKVLIKRSDVEISPLSREQLAYSEGGHRLYTDKVFVKQAAVGTQSDTGSQFLDNPNTFVTAKNIAEGRKWAEVMDAARVYVKEGGRDAQYITDEIFQGRRGFPSGEEFLEKVNSGLINKDHPFEALYDRQLPDVYNKSGPNVENFVNEDEAGYNGFYRTTGKMYTSSKGDILVDTFGDIAETVDPYEALVTSLKQVTRQSGLFAYKQESMERFLNTFRNDLDIPKQSTSDYAMFNNAKVKGVVSAERRNQIEAQRDAIKNVLSFETPQEKYFREAHRATAEWVLGSGDNVARVFAHDAINWFETKNPVGFLRGLAFDAKLGFFNIGQLFIQSSTMFSALALSPSMGLKGMSSVLPMHAYLLSKGSENVLETLSKRGVGKMAGFNTEQEFKEYARYAYNSGFMDMNGTHVMIGDTGPAAHFGSFGEKVERAREASRVFFYQAETYNRLVAYRIAWDEVTKSGVKAGSPGFSAKVAAIADDYSFNMTHESAAFWQKGLLSIPTQFWAYNVRMMDAMFGSRFTVAQKTRLIAMNLAIAGTAGVPILEAVSSYAKNTTGESPSIETLAGTLDRGIVDKLVYELNGADVRVGEKLGTGGWVTNVIQDMFGASEYGEKSTAEMLGGATYSIFKSAGGTIWKAAQYARAEGGVDLGEDGLQGEQWLKLAQEISTVGNGMKALMVNQYGIYKAKSGLIQASDLPKEDAFFVALGIRPQEVDATGHMMSYLKNNEEVIKQASVIVRNWRQEAFTNDDKYLENVKKTNAFIRLLPADIRLEVLRSTNRIQDKSLYDHIAKKYDRESFKKKALTENDQSN